MRRQQRNRDGDKPGGDERGDRQRHGRAELLPDDVGHRLFADV
jgi:hypothetical protein